MTAKMPRRREEDKLKDHPLGWQPAGEEVPVLLSLKVLLVNGPFLCKKDTQEDPGFSQVEIGVIVK